MTTRPGYIWSGTQWVEIGQSAVVAPVAYQASAPSTPATGDIWIDSDDEVPSVDSTLYYRWTKTMSGGETSLSGTDNNSLSLQYTPGYESVFINGVLQARNLDYTATSGSTIGGLTALVANDIVMVESIVAYSVGDTYTQTAANSLFAPRSAIGFSVYVDNGTTTTSGNKVAFNSVVVNTNNCWSSANNRFTAPITGKYFFSYSMLNAAAAVFYVEFRKNGTVMSTSQFPRGYVSLQYVANTSSGILELNAGDYIEMWVNTGTSHNYHCSFSGNWIGA